MSEVPGLDEAEALALERISSSRYSLFLAYRQIAGQTRHQDEPAAEPRDILQRALQAIVDELSNVLTNRICASRGTRNIVCSSNIKILDDFTARQRPRKWSVERLSYVTHIRSNGGIDKRGEDGKEWNSHTQPISIQKNEIFRDLLRNSKERDLFLNNSLADYYRDNGHENPRGGWEKKYNSAIVVPLTDANCIGHRPIANGVKRKQAAARKNDHASRLEHPPIFGLLSVDSLRDVQDDTTKFDRERDGPFLRRVAWEIAQCYQDAVLLTSYMKPNLNPFWSSEILPRNSALLEGKPR